MPPGGAYYEFMIGLQLESQGDSAGATAAYQRAERLDPQSAEIPAALAELYARMNRPADAIAAGERAVKANPTNPEANWILGSLYARMAEMPNTRAGRSAHLHRARDCEPRKSQSQRAPERADHARTAVPRGPSVRQSDCAARAVRHRSARPGRSGCAARRSVSGDRSRCRGDRAAREVGRRTRPSCTARSDRCIRMPGRWRDAARAFDGAVEERPQSLPLRAQWATALLNVGDAQRAREVLEAGSAGNSRNSARAVSAVRSAAPHARFRRGRSDRAPADRARCARARRAAPARADLPSTRTSIRRSCPARADRHRPSRARRTRPT